jgi:hypothetical protein
MTGEILANNMMPKTVRHQHKIVSNIKQMTFDPTKAKN